VTHHIEVVIYREDEQWVAQALNVDVSSFGASPEEAWASITKALELYFEHASDTVVPEVAAANGIACFPLRAGRSPR
jgi:predicted RNase H-like HicB family nuclease